MPARHFLKLSPVLAVMEHPCKRVLSIKIPEMHLLTPGTWSWSHVVFDFCKSEPQGQQDLLTVTDQDSKRVLFNIIRYRGQALLDYMK